MKRARVKNAPAGAVVVAAMVAVGVAAEAVATTTDDEPRLAGVNYFCSPPVGGRSGRSSRAKLFLACDKTH